MNTQSPFPGRALRAWEKAARRWDRCRERENRQLLRPLLCQLPEPCGCRCGRTVPAGAGMESASLFCSARCVPQPCPGEEQGWGLRPAPTHPSPTWRWSSSGADAATRMQDIAGAPGPNFPQHTGACVPGGGQSQPNRALARTCQSGRAGAAVPRATVCLGSPRLRASLSRHRAPRGNSWMSKTRPGSGAGIWLGTW